MARENRSIRVKVELDDDSPGSHKLGDKSETSSGFPDGFDDLLPKERLKSLLMSEQQLGCKSELLEVNTSGGMKKKPKVDQNVMVPENQIILNSSLLSTNLENIKHEPKCDELHEWNGRTSATTSFIDCANVKSDIKTAYVDSEDALDHMLLRERMRLLSRSDSCLDTQQNSESTSKTVPLKFKVSSVGSKPKYSQKVKLLRKRRRTATDSIETALDEDAPGLLQALIDRGVILDEIKLYDEFEGHADSNDLSIKEEFSELEEVVEKVFWKRDSFLKFGQLQSTNSDRRGYCIECLLALVEQGRYLRFRKWPVEWGWCRDLMSFIFVFERHNRIVIERPEYGYATYFFELADFPPINWQIKRLVTAMKLSSCSRITLLENKPLMIGEDLSEGEARVLRKFGWVPNTGLGAMLNYCDRVIHDRMNEKTISEWRSKIGNLLMNGYNSGRITSTGYTVVNSISHPSNIKLEFS